MILAAILFLLAQQQPPQPSTDAELQKELEKAIQADQAAAAQKGQAQQQVPQAAAPASGTAGPVPQTLFRGAQTLNPDLSVILDGDFGVQRRAPQFLNGDDPDLHGEGARHAIGFTAQEVELAASAIVDPYFRGDVFLTIPNLEGIEVEEAFATTTSLPWNLQIKAGSFRSAFGRQNGQHLHIQDFTRRPLINSAFLGADGLRGPGAQVSWLAPLPFYLTLYGEAFSIREEPGPGPVLGSFGGDGSARPTAAAEAKAFFPFGDEWSFYTGLNAASGKSPGFALGSARTLGARRETQLFGWDGYLKWKPANVAQGYSSLALQAEAVLRHLGAGHGAADEWDGGAYAQAVLQLARRWFVGVRGDIVGAPSSSALERTERAAASLTFQPSEFARVRGYAELEHGGPLAPSEWAPAAYIQVEISMGAHGAHPF